MGWMGVVVRLGVIGWRQQANSNGVHAGCKLQMLQGTSDGCRA